MGETSRRDLRLSYIHPGVTLREDYLVEMGKSPQWLADRLRMPISEVVEILAGVRPITAAVALRLSRFLGTSPELWLGLQADFDLEVARDTLEAELELIQPHRFDHLVYDENGEATRTIWEQAPEPEPSAAS